MCAGRVGASGHNTGFALRGHRLFMNPASPQYLIGVDTGGTYTDAAIIEAAGQRVIATAKSITTKGDLSIGVADAITRAMAAMPQGLHPQDIALVSVSTTLATNAVVEGHGSAVGVLLVGFDASMAERTGIAKAFPGMALARIAGGHDHNGEQAQALDLDALDEAIEQMAPHVDAFAVAAAFAVRNPAHEQLVRSRIVEKTGKPVTLSTELSSSLDAPRRALTATLNARLISRVTHLIEAVQSAMARLHIACPLMIVKGDGTLALAHSVAKRPIETVLSGPAASLVGARWLSGLNNFILSDMGGTTTDVGALIDGLPRVNLEGAEVGGWRTMVRAIDVRTIGLGGDSEVLLAANGRLEVRPQRIVPVSLLAARYPQTLDLLQADLADVEGGNSMQGRFVLLPFGAKGPRLSDELSARESELLAQVRPEPTPLRTLATTMNATRAIHSLQRKGLIQVAGFTPSDAGHVLGLQDNWSREGAFMAAQLGCRLREMKFPTPERTEQYARDVWSETVRLSARAILDTALGFSLPDDRISQAVCSGEATLGLARISIKPAVPVVAVGGPVKVFYGELARRLDCEVVFPPHGEVANAVGAATGVVAATVQVEVHGDGSGVFRVMGAGLSQSFGLAADALQAAEEGASAAALAAVQAMGASAPEVEVSVEKKYFPQAKDERGLMEAVFTAKAVGRP